MKEDDEATLALRAMERAARIARQLAAEKNLKLPIWKDGAIVYIDPKDELQTGQQDAPY